MARDKWQAQYGHQWLSRMTARMTGVVIRAGERARHAVWRVRVRNLMVVIGEVVLCPTLLGTARLYFSMSCFR
eukprot:COSAG02_NODE_7585_length_2947_cov_2.463834_2_plen_73_part_00